MPYEPARIAAMVAVVLAMGAAVCLLRRDLGGAFLFALAGAAGSGLMFWLAW